VLIEGGNAALPVALVLIAVSVSFADERFLVDEAPKALRGSAGGGCPVFVGVHAGERDAVVAVLRCFH
jgi:hypothetical protein